MKQEKVLYTLGISLISIALLLFLFNFLHDYKSKNTVEELNKIIVDNQSLNIINAPEYTYNENIPMPIITLDDRDYIGIISSSKIGLELPVLKDGVSNLLNNGPYLISGSIYKNNLIILDGGFGNGFKYLKNLSYGDNIIFKDLDNNIFVLSLVEIENLNKIDIDNLNSEHHTLCLIYQNSKNNYLVAKADLIK